MGWTNGESEGELDCHTIVCPVLTHSWVAVNVREKERDGGWILDVVPSLLVILVHSHLAYYISLAFIYLFISLFFCELPFPHTHSYTQASAHYTNSPKWHFLPEMTDLNQVSAHMHLSVWVFVIRSVCFVCCLFIYSRGIHLNVQ